MDTTLYKDTLTKELENLTAQLQSLGVQDPKNKQDWVTAQSDTPKEADPNDVADRVEAYDTARATLATLETRYNNIVAALQALTDNTYGICTVCNNPIESARLNANPAAQTCIAHK